jgi:hypothetical protein
LVKLRFEQPLATKQRRLTSLGWAPYKVAIDSPLIEARQYHFEAQSPPGLRITEAKLSDDEHESSVSDSGFLRRVHLYRPDAQNAGAGTAVLWLRVSGQGFSGGAPLAALLVTVALFACLLGAKQIAANPSSAPALLLVLPGLIASYIGRPDEHALTTRLLSAARRLLLFAAALAYTAALKVALGGGTERDSAVLQARTDSLRWWLGVLAFLSVFSVAGLLVTRYRARVQPRSLWGPRLFRQTRFVAATPGYVLAQLRTRPGPTELLPGYELVADDGTAELIFVRSNWHGSWVLTVRVHEDEGDSIVDCTGEHITHVNGLPAAAWLVRRQAKEVAATLDSLQAYALDP